MKRFENGARVVVAQGDHPLRGKAGTVKRLRMADDGAWVAMDEALPDGLRSFPADDPHGRGSHVILWPEDCQPEVPA